MYDRMLSRRDNIIEVLNHLIRVPSFFPFKKREVKILRREGKNNFHDVITNFI